MGKTGRPTRTCTFKSNVHYHKDTHTHDNSASRLATSEAMAGPPNSSRISHSSPQGDWVVGVVGIHGGLLPVVVMN